MKVGLALGGGGAKGLAHIPMLEVFDDLGIRPHRITGTSIGSIMGALYASGLSGQAIREGTLRMVISDGESFRDILKKKDVLRWFEFLDVTWKRTGLFKGDKFIEFLYDAMGKETFEELEIPLQVVATDFWTEEEVVFDRGDLRSAVKASMGLPGVFTPVERDGRVLIDGGGVNPVPHDLLMDDCDLVVALDVMGMRQPEKHRVPHLVDAVLGMFDIMQNSIVKKRNALHPPHIYVRPEITGIGLLDFYKAEEVFAQAAPAVESLRRQLESALSG